MYSAFANTLIVLSIGILMAHAMDAFRSGSWQTKAALTTASQAVRTAPSGALGAVNLWRRFTHRNGGGPFRERRDYPAHLLLFLLGPALRYASSRMEERSGSSYLRAQSRRSRGGGPHARDVQSPASGHCNLPRSS
jgi:hypothetical protein